MEKIKDIIVDFGGNDFLRPYFYRAFGVKDGDIDNDIDNDNVIDSDTDIPVTAAVSITVEYVEWEKKAEFEAYAQSHSLPLLVLRCPNIVGTGMRGFTREIAQKLYSGRYVHVKDNDSKISVVHAVDVARAVLLAKGEDASYILTDGCEHSIHDLAEAFAYRLNDKRLMDISAKWAKWWMGRKFFDRVTKDHIATDTFAPAHPDFTPNNVTEYLYNHVYDENSL